MRHGGVMTCISCRAMHVSNNLSNNFQESQITIIFQSPSKILELSPTTTEVDFGEMYQPLGRGSELLIY
jgi:hypothetical protein